ncbi:uncharacterized protein SOCE26_041360 [Sorangium cellulosum]|uniref:Uncharacterized protein n=1 Tax=Sorangium cellulosum TaxID=56 RepID=A0A2L0ETT1_SORCE|nr:hypothetical protein [Sorangium cellulosum]AUX42703.1 uncharacterized protein SOCE26_041360 [Sorangium cellulosum]
MTGGVSEPFEQAETRGGLTLERYAEIMAHVRHFPRARSPEVLERLGLTEARWEDIVLAWTDALAAESALEEEALSRRFGTAFVATAARLKKEQPALPSLGLLPEERASAPAAGAGAVEGERGGEGEREALPTAAPAPTAPRIERPSYAIAAAQSPPTAAAPGVAVPPVVPPAVVSPPAAAPAPAVVSPPAAAPGAAVPPVVPPAMVPPAIVRPPVDPSAVPVGMRQFSSIQQTHPVADAGKGAALPFETPSPGAPPPVAERAASPAEAAAGPRRAAPVGRETEDISSVMANLRQQGTVLPFAPSAKPAQPARAPETVQAPRAPETAQAPRAPETARPPQGPPAAAPAGSAGPSSPTLSLEQYASLCVELTLHPGRVEETLKRYRINEEQRAKLDAYWQARIAGDPGVASAWKRAYVFYRDWLLKR